MTDSLPEGLLLAFYGDDFTGSTDAMEVTAMAGLRTVLFTAPPSEEDLARFAGCRVIGIAGTARARSPEWMAAQLPPIFDRLAALGPRILQYKVCSTFDSAPHTGSIGKATELGAAAVPPGWIPSIVGAPQLGRFQAFGSLFATASGRQYRIDRHPTMARHPVTPMTESDLRLHLARQTDLPIGGIDLAEQASGDLSARIAEAKSAGQVTFLDVACSVSQRAAGAMVWETSGETVFCPSSSGLQYALAADPARAGAEVARILDAMSGAFADNRRGVLVYAARTVDDPAYAALQTWVRSAGMPLATAQAGIGAALGQIALRAVPRFALDRVVIAGGDTSGRVLETLPVLALKVAHPLAPGAPICHCHAKDPDFDGLQVVLKGGQLGPPDVFCQAMGPKAPGN